MTNDEQLQLWADGKLVGLGKAAHVIRKVGKHVVEECCPDFSCCQPELLVSEWLRKEFVKNEEGRERMLMGFLGSMISSIDGKDSKGKKVYLAGGLK
jgi:hypothetical protein